MSDRDSGRTGRHDGFRVARRTVPAIVARDLVPRSSFDRRSIESRVPWRRRIPRWRPRRRPPGEEVHPRFLRSWDPWCVGCAGTVRAIGAGRRQSLLRRETAKERTQIFWRNASRSRTNGRSWDFASSLVIARALYARRSTLDRVPPDAPRRGGGEVGTARGEDDVKRACGSGRATGRVGRHAIERRASSVERSRDDKRRREVPTSSVRS